MDIQVSRTDHDVTHVRLAGEVDISTSTELRRTIGELIDSGQTRLLLDLLEVRYIDSSGLVAFVVLLKRLRERFGKLVLVCDQPSILRVFRLTGLAHVFDVSPDHELGLQRFCST